MRFYLDSNTLGLVRDFPDIDDAYSASVAWFVQEMCNHPDGAYALVVPNLVHVHSGFISEVRYHKKYPLTVEYWVIQDDGRPLIC